MKTQQLIQMLKKIVLISIFFFFVGQIANAQYFVKSYDFPPFTTRTEVGRSIEIDFTGGWSIAGYSNSKYHSFSTRHPTHPCPTPSPHHGTL